MQIKVIQSFKHGRDAYTAGDVRTVSDEDAAYFKAHGWTEPATAQDPVTLDVQPVRTNQEHRNG